MLFAVVFKKLMNTTTFLTLSRSLNAAIKEECAAAIGVRINLLSSNEISKISTR
jgi:hypothetical protein